MTNSEYLKLHTRSHHDEIESSIDLLSLCSDQDHYVRLLQAFNAYYEVMEHVLDSFNDDFELLKLDLKTRKKTFLLKDDLLYFKALPLKDRPSPLKLTHFAEAVGALYVLEGSTLGGQVIFSKLRQSGIIGENGEGAGFFRAYGSETILRWKEFKERVDAMDSSLREDMLRSAQNTFDDLRIWLTKVV